MAFATPSGEPVSNTSRVKVLHHAHTNISCHKSSGHHHHHHHHHLWRTHAAAFPFRKHYGTDLSLFPRGGAAAAASATVDLLSTPDQLFNVTLAALALLTVTIKLLQITAIEQEKQQQESSKKTEKPAKIKSIQTRFLSVFWLLRAADWLQGPYFYEVYASKVIGGVQASFALVSRLFLTGFASTALFGPYVGRAADQYGRKKATVAFTVIYALGALSTKSSLLQVLLLGRVLSGIGTSLLFSAPESWLVAEAQNSGFDYDGKYLGETFGLAYAGDSIVAIAAGQLAASAAARRGPTGPFELSTTCLALGGVLTALLWGENKPTLKHSETTSIREAVDVVRGDPKILLVGAVQSLFEAAMYIFVLQWPPAMAAAVGHAFPSAAAAVPYGTIFSCFMACCLLGSTAFGQLSEARVSTEKSALAMLGVATAAMSLASWAVNAVTPSLAVLTVAFFAFECTVGMYFPSIGTLRSRYVPDSHRSVIMNLFGIPLNVLVVTVFLSINKLGVGGALTVSSAALGLATVCMYALRRMVSRSKEGGKPVLDYDI